MLETTTSSGTNMATAAPTAEQIASLPKQLRANLALLSARQPDLANRISLTEPAAVEWIETPQGLSGVYQGRALASKRTPRDEAKQWAAAVDINKHAAIAVCGFGLGWHLVELAERQATQDAIFILETDVALLRAVFERIDLSGLLNRQVYILTSGKDSAGLAHATGSAHRSVALGLQIVDHVPSLVRLGGARRDFFNSMNASVSSARIVAASELLQVENTFRNVLNNLDHYATRPGLRSWEGVLAGRAAVVVAAGPSLAKTIDELAKPGVCDRVLIIAVQTVLKTLLARGIKPHIVCALDHHAISARFYEGLTKEMVEGVTLICEPKVNPAVPIAYPGEIRMPFDSLAHSIIPEKARRRMGTVPQGTTVAHLAYYLARFFGCDPVAVTGLDLGFTDGTYYASGAAIHQVWAGELSDQNTLEMLEWQRIKRMGHALRPAKDPDGRPIYTDEQMNTYLQHFLAEFKLDSERGLTTIDATEGGVAKEHTVIRTMRETLGEWLEKYKNEPTIADLLEKAGPGPMPDDEKVQLADLNKGVRDVRADLHKIAKMSKDAEAILVEIREHRDDRERVERLVMRLDKMREEVVKYEPAWPLLTIYNALGSFKTWRADRSLRLDEKSLDALQVQQRQVERDLVNVQWLGAAAGRFAAQLDAALATLDGKPRVTGELTSICQIDDPQSRVKVTCRAVVPVLTMRSGLGVPRDLTRVMMGGRSVVAVTVERLLRVDGSQGVTLLTDQAELVRGLLGSLAEDLRVEVSQIDREPAPWPDAVAKSSRLWSRSAWRGGLANMTCYDEVLEPAMVARVLSQHGVDAALVCGADWALVDPEIASAMLERLGEQVDEAEGPRVVFSQAAPGLAPMLITRLAAERLAAGRLVSGVWGGLSSLTGYVPVMPSVDPIASWSCVKVDVSVRDAVTRCVADSPAHAAWLATALAHAGLDAATASSTQVAAAIAAHAQRSGTFVPWHLHLKLSDERGTLAASEAIAAIDRAKAARPDVAVTIEGDVLGHAAWEQVVGHAVQRAAGVRLRCGPLERNEQVEAVLRSGVVSVSIDIVALRAEAFAALRPDLVVKLGPDAHAITQRLLEKLVNGCPLDARACVRSPWVVPRMTRCDATYEDIEAFYDQTIYALGWAVIEPKIGPSNGERLRPLVVPELARRRAALETRVITPGGGEK